MSFLKKLLYLLKYDVTRNRWVSKSYNSNYYGIILMFHHVDDGFVDTDNCCKSTIADFKTNLENYVSHGYTFVSVSKALNIVKQKEKRRFVVVTFDDIPDSVYINAYPILKDKQIPFTIFVTPSFVNKEGFITRKHLLELNQDPLCTIGAHTMTHPMLREEQNSKWEIEQSKKELEALLGKTVKYFAYPFGRYEAVSSSVIKEVEEAGFECAFCTVNAPITEVSSHSLFFLPRVVPVMGFVDEFKEEWLLFKAIKSVSKRLINKVGRE